MAIVHAIVSFVGMLYVEASILRNGNEKLLNDLKEAVIIIDQETGLVLFVNHAAKRFNIRKNKNLEVNFSKNTDESIFDKKQELFAYVDMDIFRNTKLGDSQYVIDKIVNVSHYKSIEEIINFQSENAAPNQKFFYKLLD